MGALAIVAPEEGWPDTAEVDEIRIVDRVRPIDQDWVEALAVDIDRRGQLQRVGVSPLKGGGWRLLFGAHRVHACGRLDRPVKIEVFTGSALEARGRELAENLIRRELSPIDRAAFVAELYEIEKALNGWEEGTSAQAYAASKRWTKDASLNLRVASGLADAVAAKVGLSAPAIYRDLALHRSLTPAARLRVAEAAPDAPASQLRTLAKLDPARQAEVAERLASGSAFADALAPALPAKVQPSAEDKRLSAFLGAWGRMGVRERKAALRQLIDLGLPKGFVLSDGGEA